MTIDQHKVLIANRGEIAMRVMRACTQLNLDFVCVYTQEDRDSAHVHLARELAGEGGVYKIISYLDANELFAVADDAGATALHPGYGFFAEDFRFARRVVRRDRPMEFIGPSWWVIRDLGDKINTKRIARSLDVPTVPGSDRPVYSEVEAEEIAASLFEFQATQGVIDGVIMVKASAGGGGMGIEEVGSFEEFRSVFRRIRNYAKRNFGDEGVLIEQRIFDFNHLEVQIVCERGTGRQIHFGTRNCSIQSSGKQKRLEVAPGFAPGVIPYTFDAAAVLADITKYSLSMAHEAGYDNVGTWEWIVTPKGEPFLMEVNTRIQVENGVSSIISRVQGKTVNIITEQLRLALGEPLRYTQDDITFEGIGIEYRIVSENTEHRFTPCAGRITRLGWQDHDWLEVHTHVPKGEEYEIPMEYDPNLALAIVWGKDLDDAKARGLQFLEELVLEGTAGGREENFHTNIAFLKKKTNRILEF
ncbi:biotin carboxylase N-terminal domain-containing protein [Pseudodesulfovibrio piezophilus]|uniref:biotin carboxylase n=1 Tax=Pseudodesulfovibrio piezophilus (strain DSM 21447 / JCM 15486 / C1TLV30) TaxID=1322246 RepID=M1WND3_PSEP2|nr:biotin carboxylase N-terminal domain-containing protein [Pseudodesulfovibrio piezophilus]CCH47504.1 Pyruvate carboxylase/acetyl-CoA carboxylase subunit (biotin carboxylase subunit) [Pseudodesulfovibrio piezophilus C1TLV30]